MSHLKRTAEFSRTYEPAPGYHVFKIRVAGLPDKDFVETEVCGEEITTLADFIRFCCFEFHIPCTDYVAQVRKLPCTRVRGDADVKRFQTYETFELILVEPETILVGRKPGSKSRNDFRF